MNATLVCWSCGEERRIEVKAPPQFAFEVAGWANDVGWLGVIDMNYNRSLVFCGQACQDAQTTKAGTIRARPRQFKKTAA